MINSCKLLKLYARYGFNFCSLRRSENIEEFESTNQFGFAHCSIIVNVRSIIVQCVFEFRIIVCLGLSNQPRCASSGRMELFSSRRRGYWAFVRSVKGAVARRRRGRGYLRGRDGG